MIGRALKIRKENPDGTWEATMGDGTPDKAIARRFLAMTEEWRQRDYWNGQNHQHTHDMQEIAGLARERGERRRGVRRRRYFGRHFS